jgi:PIN domain nuclease of toxin-antitoxin system
VRVLLDTHAFLWWLDGDRRFSRRARAAVAREETEVFVSAVSAWEVTTKARLGRLPGAADVAADVLGAVLGQGFLPLDITTIHAQRAGWLESHTQDPWDRMLIAQAQAEGLALVSNEKVFDRYGVSRVW